MPTGYIPILQIKTKDGKWLPVNAIGGQVASKVLYNNAYPTVEQALDYLFENGTGGGGGGTGGASTAANVSYTNTQLPNVKNVKTALDELVPNSHSHDNKSVLDKFAETDGKPTYNGKVLGEKGEGASDFIIKMTVASDDNVNFIVTSCDATVEQIDAAVAAEKRVVVIASYDGSITELPMLQGVQGDSYYFGTFFSGQTILSSVYKGSEGGSQWDFQTNLIYAGNVSYYNAALPSISTVEEALNKLVPKSHTHDNKGTLDKLSDSNGVLKYNNRFIIPQKISEGSNITLADNTEYRLTNVTTLNLSYPTGDFECWMRLSCAASDKVTVTLPAGTKYIGAAPDFKNGETWELSFKDKVLIAQKVGDGSMTPIETVEDGTEVSY